MHVFLYYSALHFFNITAQKTKLILGITLSFLSLGLILSMALSRFSDIFLIKYLYFLTAFWAGILATIILASVLVWLFVLIFKSNNLKIILGSLAILVPFLYGIYGYWNAQDVYITNIDINIKNLPDNWKDKKIIQLSDVHLGEINDVSFAEKIVEKVNNEKPDLILITGDLFDGVASRIPEFLEVLNKLESKYGTYFVTGNHEVYLGVDYVLASLQKSNIKAIGGTVINIEGLQIVGLDYPQIGEWRDKNFIKNMGKFDSELPTILIYHAPTDIIQLPGDISSQQSSIYWSPDINFETAKESGVNLQLSGHTHKGQLFPYNLMANYIYEKYNYGLNTDKDFNIYTTSGVGTWGPPIRTGSNSEIVTIILK